MDEEIDLLGELDDLFEYLSIDGSDNKQLYTLYGIFLRDFVKSPVIIKGIQLSYNNAISKHPVCKGKMIAFEHIITRGSKYKGIREFDCERANKVHWIKPIIENVNDPRIKYFEKVNDNGYNQQYYWYEEKGFIVIIRELKPDLMLITSFSVDNHEKITYKNWYNEYKRK